MYLSAMIVSVVVLLSCLKVIDVSSISWLESLDRTQLDKNHRFIVPGTITEEKNVFKDVIVSKVFECLCNTYTVTIVVKIFKTTYNNAEF
jgi:hypothetical protein